MNNDETDIIKINLDYFKQKLKQYIYNDINMDNLNKKKKNLIENYSCFNEKYDSKFLWEKKKLKRNFYKHTWNTQKITNNNTEPEKKLYTFTTNKFNINKDKKTFISLLNKLSNNNKNNIYSNLKKIINSYNNIEELLDIIYIYIGKNNDVLYNEVLLNIIEIDKNIFYESLKKLKYIIDEKFIIINIMNDVNYNEFCDFKKDKTKYLNLFNAYMEIIEKTDDSNIIDIFKIISVDIISIINNLEESKSYVINYYLELLLIIRKKIDIDIFNIDISKYDKSTKFILDKFNL